MQSKTAIEQYIKTYGSDGHSIIAPEPLVKMGFEDEFVAKETTNHKRSNEKRLHNYRRWRLF